MSNPLDEYMKMRKEAGFLGNVFGGAAQQELGKKLMGGAATAAGAMLIGGGVLAISKIRDSITRKDDFKRMMSVDPELRDIQSERPQFFNQAYNSLRRMNPAFGRDPIVAGSFMRKMMANPDAAGLTIAQTVKMPEGPTDFRAEVGPFKIGL